MSSALQGLRGRQGLVGELAGSGEDFNEEVLCGGEGLVRGLPLQGGEDVAALGEGGVCRVVVGLGTGGDGVAGEVEEAGSRALGGRTSFRAAPGRAMLLESAGPRKK